MRSPLLAFGAVLVALAVAVAFGNYHPLALALLAGGTASTAAALATRTERRGGTTLAEAVFAAGISAGLAIDLIQKPGWYAKHPALPGFRPLLVLAGALVASHLWPRPNALVARWRFPTLAAAFLVLVALVLHAVPAPPIDVWEIQQGGAAALASGDNPYAAEYPNRYGPGTPLLAEGMLSQDGRRIRAYPYPPLTVLEGLASLPFGDVRWAHAGLTLLAAFGVRALGGRTRLAELAATFVLFQPRTLFVIEEGWTEPLVLACFVGLAWVLRASVRPEPVEGRTVPAWLWPGIMAGLALAAKQYAPLLLLPFLPAAPPRTRWVIVVLAAVVAALLYLPYALWDPAALWRSLVTFHLGQPFRPDSLSFAAALHAWTGARLPSWPGFLAAAAILAAAWRGVRSPSGALAVGALAWLSLLFLAKQAFANYHWLAVGLLCAAVAGHAPAEDPGPGSPVMEAN